MPAAASRQLVAFGPFEFDACLGLLYRGEEEIYIPPRAAGVLECLLEQPGEVAAKQALLDAVWADSYVSDTSLSEAVGVIRHALGDDPQKPTYIKTLHRRGYQFIADVRRVADLHEDLAVAAETSTPIKAAALSAPLAAGAAPVPLVSVGSSLGQYEILAELGAGAMGVVYRARDTVLEREVAIKVLPEDFVSDPERVARFEQEAKLLASVSHPNIASIHSLEKSDGVTFPVLELVEGETLDQRLRSGPLTVSDALETARQIASAIEAAHERGIIHRDLKPANIKLTPDGQVKVLDFGLAKALEVNVLGSAAGESPTESMTIVGSRRGSIVGTAAYMSPEQARGEEVDKRADIWSFGCVFYELLTGRRAFAGDTVSETIAGVLERDPDWGGLPPTTHPIARALLRRCLRKDPVQRLHHVADARIEIDEAQGDPAEGMPGAVPGETAQAPLWRRATPWSIAVVMAALAAVVFYWPRPDVSGPALHVAALPADVEPRLFYNQPPPFAISPDGTRLAYWEREGGIGDWQLHVKPMHQRYGEPIAEPGSVGVGSSLAFSPDGEQVAFAQGDKLWRLPASGGPRFEICDLPGGAGSGLRGASWGANDSIVLGLYGIGLARVAASGGEVEQITDERGHRWPQILPGGDAVVLSHPPTAGGNHDDRAIAVLDLETMEIEILPEIRGTYPRYVPTGHLLFGRADSLFAVPFDLERREVTGSARPVIDGVSVDSRGMGSAHYAVSDTGLLVYSTRRIAPTELVFVDREGRTEPLGFEAGSYGPPDLSPDGKLVAIVDRSPLSRELLVLDLETGTSRRLASPALPLNPVWWPDGRTLSLSSAASGHRDIFSMKTDGSSPPTQVTAAPSHQDANTVSPSGDVLVYQGLSPGRIDWDLYATAFDSDAESEILVQSDAHETAAAFSPNGRFLAYTSTASGRAEVYVLPYPDDGSWGKPGRPISINGGGQAVWGPDGRELFFIAGDRLMVAAVTTAPEFGDEQPVEVVELAEDIVLGGSIYRPVYDVMPDGEHFIFRREVNVRPAQLLMVVNWFEELRRLVPTEQ